jgi:acetyltransferase-like isoleucine patch superfamily enzyme
MMITMQRSRLGDRVARLYGRTPGSKRMLDTAVRMEGGQMTSLTLRAVLRSRFGVEVGSFSYGGLLVPGAADTGTMIGNYVSIGAGVRRFGAAHPVDDFSMHPYWYNPRLGLAEPEQDVPRSSIDIGHDSWIGANSIILPKVGSIGIGAVVGAGSVVTRDVPAFAIAVGSPARVVGFRLSERDQERLLAARPWLLPPEEAGAELRRLREGRGS